MNKTALRIVARDHVLRCIVALAAVSLGLVWASSSATVALVWTVIYLAASFTIGCVFYSVERDRITRNQQLLGRTQRLDREMQEREAERERRHEEFMARLDDEAERAELEDEIIREDHERRMLEIEVTGKDPGPSGRSARIRAEREARATASAARARMERKARMAARKTTTTADEAVA